MVVPICQFGIHFIEYLHHECRSKNSFFPKGDVFLDAQITYYLVEDQSVPHLPFIDRFSHLFNGRLLQLCTTTSIKSLVTKINPHDPFFWLSQNLNKTNFKFKLTYLSPKCYLCHPNF
jgi:hypothetical protein